MNIQEITLEMEAEQLLGDARGFQEVEAPDFMTIGT
jgi:hypothetical protein